MSDVIENIKKLRDITQAGISDCKKAYEQSGGDFDKAIDILRKNGVKVAASKAGRTMNEGIIVARISIDRKCGIAIVLTSETDFVSRNENFKNAAGQIADVALKHKPSSLQELKQLTINDTTVDELVVELIGKNKENIALVDYCIITGDLVATYVHSDNKLAVVVGFDNVNSSEDNDKMGNNIAMQIAAMNPVAICQENVPNDVLEKEREIIKEQITDAKSPEILQKMVEGRIKKFYKENVLLEQQFIKDDKIQIKDYLTKFGAKVSSYKRITI